MTDDWKLRLVAAQQKLQQHFLEMRKRKNFNSDA